MTDRCHRLPVVRIESALHPKELVAHVVHRRCRERLEIGLGSPEPDDGFDGKRITAETELCKILHKRRWASRFHTSVTREIVAAGK